MQCRVGRFFLLISPLKVLCVPKNSKNMLKQKRRQKTIINYNNKKL